MNKQGFINKILKVGNGKPIDVSAIDPCGKINQWCVNVASNYIKWDERLDTYVLGRAIFIDGISKDNPPTQLSNIRFYSEGMTQVDELDEAWLTERINELPFTTGVPDFEFKSLYCQWYDHEQKKRRTTIFDFTDKKWYEDSNECNTLHVVSNDTVYFGFAIKNKGDASGIPVFRVEKSTGENILRVQGDSLAPGAEWTDKKGWSYDGETRSYKFLACSYKDNSDIIHDDTGASYLQLVPTSPPTSKCPLAALFTGTILLSVLPSVRVFRDRVLARNEIGRRFIEFYYGKFKDLTVPLIVKSNIVRAIGIALVTPLIPLVKLMVFEIER